MSAHPDVPLRRVKSFVCRKGRMTAGQERALEILLPRFGLSVAEGVISPLRIFGREAPCFLEVGFGMGHSLVEAAASFPEQDFIGVETHLPGIGALLAKASEKNLTNLRVYHADVLDVLAHCIEEASLSGIQIFFPDPWPKRKHRKRRLVQSVFVHACIEKLKQGGLLHLATDWEDYAVQMMRVLSGFPALSNLAGSCCYAKRSALRPVPTRFEKRGGQVWELAFVKKEK